ncbi:hypothetical protein NQ315_012186 [Exocentrus adspersus]|uniref:Proline-rich nuclear receptor coactivator 1 n=1 Tax=Exocentrus adspersus TaxID=1586481 RepID=A0AAV8VXZ5_9CUCU|nr:hypothetical protein NQ315_012186 [Exocentrus adspersus]
MAKKHLYGKIIASTNGKLRATRHPSKAEKSCTYQGSPLQMLSPDKSVPRQHELTPVKVQPPSPKANLKSSPRTSPGLLAGHYAGCKFLEPPLPSALPLPPQHWMQTTTRTLQLPFRSNKSDHYDVAQQLKVLLKVQA